jgi:hypothetical protein
MNKAIYIRTALYRYFEERFNLSIEQIEEAISEMFGNIESFSLADVAQLEIIWEPKNE